MSSTLERRSTALHVGAAFAGLAIALGAALGFFEGRETVATGVANVNGTPIAHEEYARALVAMQAGLSRDLTLEDKRRAIDLLIDEELLVQRGIALGLAADDRLTRKYLVRAMIRSATFSAPSGDPNDDELRTFFEQNAALFDAAPILTVRAVRAADAEVSAALESALKNGTEFEQARTAVGATTLDVPPQTPVPQLGSFIGASARDTAMGLHEGEVAGPIATPQGDLFVQLIERRATRRSFEEMAEDVRSEWERRRDERTFQDYLARLRRDATIAIDENALAATTGTTVE